MKLKDKYSNYNVIEALDNLNDISSNLLIYESFVITNLWMGHDGFNSEDEWLIMEYFEEYSIMENDPIEIKLISDDILYNVLCNMKLYNHARVTYNINELEVNEIYKYTLDNDNLKSLTDKYYEN